MDGSNTSPAINAAGKVSGVSRKRSWPKFQNSWRDELDLHSSRFQHEAQVAPSCNSNPITFSTGQPSATTFRRLFPTNDSAQRHNRRNGHKRTAATDIKQYRIFPLLSEFQDTWIVSRFKADYAEPMYLPSKSFIAIIRPQYSRHTPLS